MKLSPAAFNAHLNHLGQDFTWRKAYACPCVNPHSGAAKPNCPHCDGKGRLWDAPAVGKAGIVGRDQLRKFADFGLWDQGDIMLSIPSDSPLYAMGQFDRVTATNRSEQFSMNFVRGLNDRIRHVIIAIERVFWIGSGDVLVEGNIPAIGADGTLTWADGAPPGAASVRSLRPLIKPPCVPAWLARARFAPTAQHPARCRGLAWPARSSRTSLQPSRGR